jgi:hypothetical protein
MTIRQRVVWTLSLVALAVAAVVVFAWSVLELARRGF